MTKVGIAQLARHYGWRTLEQRDRDVVALCRDGYPKIEFTGVEIASGQVTAAVVRERLGVDCSVPRSTDGDNSPGTA